MVKIDASMPPEKPTRKRMLFGTLVVVVGQLAPLLVPLVASTGLSVAWKGFLSFTLFFVVPELCLLTAIAIWGKPGYVYIKGKVFALFRRALPPDTVSPVRYRIGLVMFTVPLVFGWITPYLTAATGESIARTPLAVAGDVLFIASFFVLGGDFWDKFRALFVQRATVQFPRTAAAEG